MNDKQPTQLAELEIIVGSTNKLAIPDKKRVVLIDNLKPIASRILAHVDYAETLTITSPEDAKKAMEYRESVIKDGTDAVTALEGFDKDDTGKGIIDRLFTLHRGWTALRGKFTLPLEGAAKLIKKKIGDYEDKLAEEAEKERIRLQSEADEAARKERERLEREAAKLKTPEKKAERLEQAAQVVAPVIQIPVQKSGTSFQKRWAVKDFDLTKMGIPVSVQDFIEVKTNGLARAKAANPKLEVAGVNFHRVRV